tara:strand:- start:506 stop:1975 length:1470 start_codon:yes stop_codon:yes gene_type:complete
MLTKFISCERTDELFGASEPLCSNGDVDFIWMTTENINTGMREYQREKVADVFWKQNLMTTVLLNVFAGIPEIHIRVIKTEGGGYRYELIDGQQRVTSILDYLNGIYPLPRPMVVDGCDIGGMFVEELRNTYPAIYDRILNYRITCKWYENLTDLQTAHLFIEVLNNVNDMKQQEIRNAVLGFYSQYVRDTARFDVHELFTRIKVIKGKKEKEQLKYFSSKFSLNYRMEVDEWLSELAYLKFNGVRKGVTQPKHTQWVKDVQSPNGKYIDGFTDKKTIDNLLNLALSLFKATPDKYKVNLNSMTSMMLVLYADDIIQRFGKIIPEKFAPAFFDVYTRWSDPAKGLYIGKETFNGSVMPPFKELFGGKNSNAIGTIFSILDDEFGCNPLDGDDDRKVEVGIIEMDMRETFKRADIIRKWQDQGGACYYTGESLDEDNLAGDHYIPRSWGIDKGGVTEYDNLVVCSKRANLQKGNMSGEEFESLLKKKEAA